MAKLNVVIPAVEVTVDGVAYRKVDRKAQAGDIVKALRNKEDITGGAFYAVQDERGRHTFYDNVNDSRPVTLRSCPELFEVYAPISEPATQPSTETITFEGATWRKVDRDVREGDAIKFTDEGRSSYLTEAELYVVDRVDSCDDPQITDDDGDEYDAGSDDYEVYEKVAEEKAVEYREVKRKANVGERIKIVDKPDWEDRYKNGDTLVVKEDVHNGDVLIETGSDARVSVLYREYVVLEAVIKSAEPTKTPEPERLAVGDHARVVDFTQMYADSGVSEGSIVKITLDDGSYRPFKATLTDGSNAGWFTKSELVRATDEEVAAVKNPRSKFEIGDYAKVAVEYCEHKVGDVLKITNTASGHDFFVTNVATSRLGCIDADKIDKLTAAEVAEIERKQAEEAAKRAEETKWDAIGRKVNEYKRGDIVEILRNKDSVRAVGAVEDVANRAVGVRTASKAHTFGAEYYSAFMDEGDTITLIVPVEQRFDRVEEVDAA